METKRFKLKRKFAKNWIVALKSGLYKQDTKHAQYRYEDSFCAVGVCAIANDIKFQSDNRAEIDGIDIHIYLGSSLFAAVYTMNDQQQKTFPEIAEFLEQNVKFV